MSEKSSSLVGGLHFFSFFPRIKSSIPDIQALPWALGPRLLQNQHDKQRVPQLPPFPNHTSGSSPSQTAHREQWPRGSQLLGELGSSGCSLYGWERGTSPSASSSRIPHTGEQPLVLQHSPKPQEDGPVCTGQIFGI